MKRFIIAIIIGGALFGGILARNLHVAKTGEMPAGANSTVTLTITDSVNGFTTNVTYTNICWVYIRGMGWTINDQ